MSTTGGFETDNKPCRLAASMSDTAILVIERSGIMVVSFHWDLHRNNTHYFFICQVFWLFFIKKMQFIHNLNVVQSKGQLLFQLLEANVHADGLEPYAFRRLADT